MIPDPQGTASDPKLRPVPLLGSAGWMAVCVLALAVLGVFELMLRSGVLWQVPLPYLLPYENDRHVLVSWEVHQPKTPGVLDVVALGSSVAAAVTELPGGEATQTLRRLRGRDDVRLLVMAVPRGCFQEMTVILENLIARGRTPAEAVIFTWPGCFISSKDAELQRAQLMPLRTAWLAPDGESLSDEAAYWLAQHVEVVRHRYFVNSWVRRRLRNALRGDLRLRVPYRAYRLAKPASVPLEKLRGLDRYETYPERVTLPGQSALVLERLLDRLQSAGVKAFLVENPMSPPVERAVRSILPAYRETLEGIARRHDVPYLDPNLRVDLTGEFADLLHPTHEGGRRYFNDVAPTLASALP